MWQKCYHLLNLEGCTWVFVILFSECQKYPSIHESFPFRKESFWTRWYHDFSNIAEFTQDISSSAQGCPKQTVCLRNPLTPEKLCPALAATYNPLIVRAPVNLTTSIDGIKMDFSVPMCPFLGEQSRTSNRNQCARPWSSGHCSDLCEACHKESSCTCLKNIHLTSQVKISER